MESGQNVFETIICYARLIKKPHVPSRSVSTWGRNDAREALSGIDIIYVDAIAVILAGAEGFELIEVELSHHSSPFST